jgi:TolB-like protein
VDGRSDQYSLACVLYEVLTGEAPYTGSTPQAVIAKRMLEPVPHVRTLRESVPAAVETVLTRALARIPADRFSAMAEFARALEGAERDRTSIAAPTYSRRKWLTLRRVSARTAVILLTLALVIAGTFLIRDRIGTAEQASLPPESSGVTNPARLAVLYFRDLTGSKEHGYLADALTEALISELSQVKGLDVVSRHGAALYRQLDLPRDSIARALQVGTLVTGSVEHNSDRVRVNLHLVDGLSGADFERASLELPARMPLALRDSVVERAAELLRTRLGEEVRLRERRRSTRSTNAWSLLQRAENVRKEAESLASGDLAAAQSRYLRADSIASRSEAADSLWPAPTVFRSQIAYRISRFTFAADSARPWIERGLSHADRALAKDKQDPNALATRGTLRYWKWLLQLGGDSAQAATLLHTAQTDLEAALKIDPSLAEAWSAVSHLYMQIPDMRRAKLAAVRAYEEDTYLQGVEMVLFRLFTTSFDLDQMEEADRWCTIGARRFHDHPRFVECQLWLLADSSSNPASTGQAWRLARRLAEVTPPGVRPFFKRKGEFFVAAVLAKAGLTDSARRVAQRARATPEEDPRQELPFYDGWVHLLLGDRKAALQSLKTYFQADPNRKVHFETEGWFSDLKGDPELKALIADN